MIDIRDFSSVHDAFKSCAARYGDSAFLRAPAGNAAHSSPDGENYSYAETNVRVNELIANYAARGLKLGERVALIFDSRLWRVTCICWP